ncbi:cadherin-like beta sandwich domain-containing protein, partial [Bacteroidales bacterium OttesenSCG-928-K22]|nr:cadherin-like beta sandwich domain-containing protein [Bacteroidales bacterium OttesenSCG-928-K22]
MYNIEITNPTKLLSNASYPAKVITNYDVTLPLPVTLTWAGSGSSTKTITIHAATGTNNIIVNWGDGYGTQTFNGRGDGNNVILTSPAYGNTSNHNVSIIADNITLLTITERQVSALDVSSATALKSLQCASNQLTSLDLSDNTALTTLYCNNNNIPLVGLKNIADNTTSIAQTNKRLGTQTLAAKTWTSTTAVIDSVFNGEGTSLAVKLNGNAATAGTDYSFTDGIISFMKSGLYNIDITNPTKLVSNTSYPAKVNISYDVTLPQPIIFTWKGNESSAKTLTVRAVAGTGNVVVDWGNGSSQVFSGNGVETDVTLTSPIYGSIDNYTVSITTDNITHLNISGKQVSELNVSNATSLLALDCSSNLLSSLDLSNNTALTSLYCNNNIIPLIGLENITDNTTSITQNNKRLGTQLLETQIWNNITAVIDSIYNGISGGTSFVVTLDGDAATTGIDYTINDGVISFIKSGLYSIEITNSAELPSHTDYPAKVITSYDVTLPSPIIFTWNGNESTAKEFVIRASDGIDNVVVDWGNGNDSQVFSGAGTETDLVLTSPIYGDTENYFVSIIADAVTLLDIADNHVSNIDLSNATSLTYLYCNDNIIPLEGLKDIVDATTNIEQNNKRLGTQTLATQDWVEITAELDTVFNGESGGTSFVVNYDGNAAIEGIHYSITDNGVITFMKSGMYVIEITNPTELVSNEDYPAKVITSYNVMLPQLISLNWTGSTTSKDIFIKASAGNDNIIVDWGNGTTVTYNGDGDNEVTLSQSYDDTESYNVVITAAAGTNFTYFNTNNNQVTALNVSNASALTSLYCSSNQLSNLDLSENTELEIFDCSDNTIPLIGLKTITENTASLEQNNKFLGLQTLATQNLTNTTVVIDSVFNGAVGGTYFTVTLDGNAATEGTDYRIIDGSITFMNSGLFSVEITNPTELISNETFPAKVITSYIVTLPEPIFFTWEGEESNAKSLTIRTAIGNNNVIVNWGDGNESQFYSGAGTETDVVLTSPVYGATTSFIVSIIANDITLLDIANNKVSILNVGNATSLTDLNCASNQLIHLDVTENAALKTLNCGFNQLTSLDLSNNEALESLSCNDNFIPLAELNDIADNTTNIEQSNKRLGTQLMPSQTLTTAATLADDVFYGAGTFFAVTFDGSPATDGTDYTTSNGTIIFFKTGNYNVEITNPTELISNTDYPAKVVIDYDVTLPLPISFTWIGNETDAKTLTIRALSGNNNIIVDWGDGNTTQAFNGAGTSTDVVLTSPVYGDNESYTVSIIADAITLLNIADKQVSAIDISNATGLTNLNCASNLLTSIDVSSNAALTSLDCSSNQLSSLYLSNNTTLASLYCNNNIIPLTGLKDIADNTESITQSNKRLGTQILETQTWSSTTAIIDEVFGGTSGNTNFAVTLDENAAIEGTDYSFTGGTIIFMKSGLFNIETTNATGLVSHTDYPAKVITAYDVTLSEPITFTWAGDESNTKEFTIRAASGSNNIIVNWGDGSNTQAFNGEGTETDVTLTSPVYNNTSSHTVSIIADGITHLNLSDKQVSAIDISNATTLKSLDCSSNQLSSLDLSSNSELTYLNSNNNIIPLSGLKNIAENTTSIEQDNKLLGTQIFATNTWTNTTAVIDTEFGGESGGTDFYVTLDDVEAIEGTDYSFTGGSISFLKSGLYVIETTNATELVSNETYPAKVITSYDVTLPLSINFAWMGEGSNAKEFIIRTAAGTDNIIVDWGEGYNTQTFSGKGAETDVIITSPAYGNNTEHTVSIIANDITLLNLSDKQVTAIDVRNASVLTSLNCELNLLTSLNVSDNTALTTLYCSSNQLSSLDLSNNEVLSILYCNDNFIPLVGLKDIVDNTTSISQTNRRLGTQTLETQTWTSTSAVIDSVFNGTDGGTSFAVKYNGGTATVGTHYRITGGTIIFLKSGMFSIQITNPTELVSNASFPAKVITDYDVTLPLPINFTWAGEGSNTKEIIIRAASGSNNIVVDWGTGFGIQDYSGLGTETDVVLTSPAYNNTSNHNVSIIADGITLLNIADAKVSAINVGNATTLTNLNCSSNQLTSLDLSKNTALTSLDCSLNQLTSLDLSKNTALSSLNSNNNIIPLIGLKNIADNTSSITQSNKRLGTQTLATQTWIKNTALIDSVFNGAGTSIAVKFNGITATAGTEYSFNSGIITFLKSGLYNIEITNTAGLVSHADYPAKVIVEYDVELHWIDYPDFSWFTAGEPYLIATANDFAGLTAIVNDYNLPEEITQTNFSGKTITVTSDIDLSGKMWTPIGTINTDAYNFFGTFDGGEYLINGMTVDVKGTDRTYAGLFGRSRGALQNIRLSGTVAASTTSNILYVGGIAGTSNKPTNNCHSEVNVITTGTASNSYVGGVVGCNEGNISNCSSTGNVSSAGITNVYAGGITGYNSNVKIYNSFARGNIETTAGTTQRVGGIVAYNEGSSSAIQNNYFKGSLAIGSGSGIGGIVGYNYTASATIQNNYWEDSNITNAVTGSIDSNIKNNTTFTGTAPGTIASIEIANKTYSDISLVDALNQGRVSIPAANPTQWVIEDDKNEGYPIHLIKPTWTDEGNYTISWFSSGSNEFSISTPEELAGLAVLVNGLHGNTAQSFENKTIKIAANIDLSDKLWTPIGSNSTYSFKGTFSGSNFAVSNMEVDIISSVAVNGGLFGYVGTNGKVEEIHVNGIINGSSTTTVYNGGITGYNYGTIQNCTFSGELITNSSSTTSTYLTPFAGGGGIVGWNEGNILNCNHSGNINTYCYYSSCSGGIVGYNTNNGTIQDCTHSGDFLIAASAIRSSSYSGGIVGFNNSGTIQSCTHSGNLSASTSSTEFHACNGGIVGRNDGTVINCTHIGEVNTLAVRAFSGGIAGYNDGKVLNNFSRGAVAISATVKQSVGGIIGHDRGNPLTCFVENNYYEGTLSVASGDFIGGVVGENYTATSSIQNNYWKVSGISNAIGGTANQTGDNINNNAAFNGTFNLTSSVTAGAYTGTNMLDALNAWVDYNQTEDLTYKNWETRIDKNDNYPIFAPLYWINFPDFTWYVGKSSPYEINTPNQLAGLAAIVNNHKLPVGISRDNFSGKIINITDDINLSGKMWTPIGNPTDLYGNYEARFMGNISGGLHTISSMEIDLSLEDIAFAGLVGYLWEGKVENINTQGSINTLTNSEYVYAGGIVGYSDESKIANCSFNGYIGGLADYAHLGGIVGENSNGIVCNNFARATLEVVEGDEHRLGGIVGYHSGEYPIQNNYFEGSMLTGTATDLYIGGVVGNNVADSWASIQNNYWQAEGITNALGSNPEGENIKNNTTFSGVAPGTITSVEIAGKPYTSISLTEALDRGRYSIPAVDPLYWKVEDNVNDEYPIIYQRSTWTDEDIYSIEWYSSENAEFEISTPEELGGLAVLVNGLHGNTPITFENKTITLTDTIDLSGNLWIPIGTNTNSFKGTFSGDNFIVDNMDVDIVSSKDVYAGLFGYINISGKVEDLQVSGMINVVSATNTFSGGIVGHNFGTIQNSIHNGNLFAASAVTPNAYSGGIVGRNNGTILNCVHKGEIDVPSVLAYGGGIAGYNNNGKILNNYVRGKVATSATLTQHAGGITGYHSGDATYSIRNNYFEGTLSITSGNYLGGIVAYNNTAAAKIQNNYWKDSNNTAAAIGGSSNQTGANISDNAAFTGTGTLTSNIIAGTYSGTNMLDALKAGTKAINLEIGSTDLLNWKVETSQNDELPIHGPNYWIDYPNFDWYTSGEPYEINTPNQLAGLAAIVNNYLLPGGITQNNFEGKNITLTSDIDLSGKLWTPIGDYVNINNMFAGVFSGNNLSIINMETTRTHRFSGLFGRFSNSNAVIENLQLQGNIYATTNEDNNPYGGGIIGSMGNGTIKNCNFTGNVNTSSTTQYAYAGGIAGYNGGIIKNCNYLGGNISSISEKSSAISAGISAQNGSSGTIQNCSFLDGTLSVYPMSSNYTSDFACAGGIVGINNGNINNNYARGTIIVHRGTLQLGGIAGFNREANPVVNNNYFEGSIIKEGSFTSQNIGGAVGVNGVPTATIQNNYWQSTDVTSAIGGTANQTGENIKNNAPFTGTNTFATDITAGAYTGKDMLLALNAGAKVFNIGTELENLLLRYWKIEENTNDGYPIFRDYHTDATLETLATSVGALNPTFDPQTLEYNVIVGRDVASLTITATTTDPNASIEGIGKKTLDFGDNEFTITVTAEDRITTKEYKITIYRQSADATLLSLTINPAELNPVFNSGHYMYYDTVKFNVTAIDIVATANHVNATVTGDTGPQSLDLGANEFEIVVTADDLITTLSYFVNVYRQSNDSTLSNLAVNQGTLTPSFNTATINYTVDVERDVDSIIITATSTHPNAIITGDGEHEVVSGENTFEVVVTAENGNSKTYTIVVTRPYYLITASVDGSNGSISPSGVDMEVSAHSNQTFTITPDTNYEIKQVLVDETNDEDAVAAGSYTFSDVTDDHTIVASFISTDNTLLSLTVSEGELTPAFDPTETEYTVSVDKDITSIIITATKNHPLATVVGDGEKNLVTGTNTFEIVVTAENETTKTYTVVVTRAPYIIVASAGQNGSITPSGNVEITAGADTTFTITANVNYEIDEVLIDGANDEDVVESGSYTFSNINANHTIAASFVSTDATLANLTVSPGTLRPKFNPAITSYTVSVGKDVASILIEATKNNEQAAVVGDGEKQLATGDNTFDIVVTAENGDTKTYTIVVTRAPYIITASAGANGSINPAGTIEVNAGADSTFTITANTDYQINQILIDGTNNADAVEAGSYTFENISANHTITASFVSTVVTLSDLTISPATLHPSFASETYTYYDTVSYATDQITIAATTTNEMAVITSGQLGVKTLSVGANEFTVTVTAENGDTQNYTINVYRKSNDATLATLSIDPATLSPTFASDTYTYDVTVANAIDEITIAATTTHAEAVITDGHLGEKTLEVGANTFTVTVTAEDGNTQDYTINIYRKSTVATLATLSIDPATLSPTFASDTYTYDVTVANAIDEITIAATTTHAEAVITDGHLGLKTVNVGANAFTVTVTAEDGNTQDYTINVYRKSIDATLATLTIEPAILSPSFASNIYSYNDTVANATDMITIAATTTHSEAVITNGHLGEKTLEVGANEFTVTVTAEDGNTQDYTINIYRLSGDATLLSLTVSEGELDPEFAATTFAYEVNVGFNIEEIDITAVANDEKSEVTGNTGTQQLSLGDNVFTITVTAEDESYQDYTVTVRRQNNDALLLSLAVSEGELYPEFVATIFEYDVTVAYDVDELDITAVANDDNAEITGDTGTQTLSVGDNNFTITVTAEDESFTKNYTVNVRRKSNEATLASLVISEGELDPVFDSEKFAYSVTVGYDINGIDITAIANDANAVVSGHTGMQTLSVGNNTFTITVTAEDETYSEDYVIIVRRQADDATLLSLTVSEGELNPEFAATIFDYNVIVGNDVEELDITAVANHENAVITGDTGTQQLLVGDNDFTITVTAEDNSYSENYLVTVRRLSNDATLLSLLVSEGELDPEFAATEFEYDVIVGADIEEIIITAIAVDENAVITGDTGIQTLTVGDNVFTITVTAEDGSYQDYTITVLRQSGDASLESLTISEGDLDPGFDAEIYEYNVTVDYVVTELDITAVANDDNAEVTGDTGTQQLSVGNNEFTITVTAEDENITKNYFVNVYRLSNDATLSNILINEGELDPEFDSEAFEYDVIVDFNVTLIDIGAITNHENAEVSGDIGTQTLDVGDNVFTITVTAEDDFYTQDYTVTVRRLANDATLASIVVSEGDLDPVFDSQTFEYDVIVDYSVEEIDITAVANDENAEVSGDTGTQDLSVGDNTFTITVTAEDNIYTQNYVVNVRRMSN